MAAVSCVLSEEQFLCSICLEVFTDPVTTSCGHSFCKTCLNKHWDNTDHCQCPVCKEDFSSRPQLKVSTCLSEMVSQFRENPQDEDQRSSNPESLSGDVLCDMCSEPKLKALKSCLVCLLSYCQNHLQPHSSIPRLKKHQLIHPLKNLEERICSRHDKPLELFCREDSEMICLQCIYTDHKGHDAVPLKEQCEEEQAELERLIEERQEKIKEIQDSVELSQNNADTETAKGVDFFNELVKCVQQSLENFKQSIEDKHNKTKKEASALIEDLQSEISLLEQRRAEMEELSFSEDHLHFLQTFTSVRPAPDVKDWTDVSVRAPSYGGRVAKAVWEMEKRLRPKIKKLFEEQLNKAKKHALDVTLDPDTAHPKLVLSTDLKQVYRSDQKKNLPDNPERFSFYQNVFGKQKFSSGRFYYEVQVKGKVKGWYLGVAKESIDRKGEHHQTSETGYWEIPEADNAKFLWSSPEKVGVFVDYEEGLVCFYDVDSTALIHSYTDCCFTENILPLFYPSPDKGGNNSSPLILTPVTE